MNRREFLAVASLSALAGCATSSAPGSTADTGDTTTFSPPSATDETAASPAVSGLSVPDGFRVSTFADDGSLGGGEFRPGPEPGPRLLAAHEGAVYVTVPSQGRVVAFSTDDETATEVTTVVADLDRPHGIDFLDGQLYLATADQLLRYDLDGVAVASDSMQVLADDIPAGKYHWTRSLALSDGHLYLSAGNCLSGDCTAGNEDYLTAITRFDLDGSNPTTYATGLRNAVGIAWHDGRLFATDNGTDDLGPDLPPDEINVVAEGGDYGFPHYYGANVPVNESVSADAPTDALAPAVELPPHCAPLGFDFATGSAFPEAYRGDMFVALHGSWGREDPTGFEVVRVPYEEGTLGSPEPFLFGFLPDGKGMDEATGRPVDVLALDGTLYVSDDLGGRVYRVDVV
ncbi:PQQ-dependent sugar dehydrogenase [Salinigranum rubrum]|nr:PQQ-dependent sugar dehydrogenase [Salinigranum rubrum]